ncbi:hypothetical protein SDC9_93497 [bioreactor metagenome]|uniref:Uncharacterized protein n=1 Tax=bioreactor metagenome TaxID=1076179 RepID=A0A645A3F8_9ZZZZ
MNVSGISTPVIEGRRLALNALPFFITLKEVCIIGFVKFRRYVGGDGRIDLGCGRPNVAQVDRLALRVHSQRFARQINFCAARQSIGHHQSGRSQVIGLHQRMHAPLKVAIARDNGRYGQFVGLYTFFKFCRQRTAVANTGGAAVPGQGKAQLGQRLHQTCLFQISSDHAGTGGQTGLDPGPGAQAACYGFFGKQSCPQHDERV